MVMMALALSAVPVERLTPISDKGVDLPGLGQGLQGSVYRAQANTGSAGLDDRMELLGRAKSGCLSHGLRDCFALTRWPLPDAHSAPPSMPWVASPACAGSRRPRRGTSRPANAHAAKQASASRTMVGPGGTSALKEAPRPSAQDAMPIAMPAIAVDLKAPVSC